MKFTWLSNAPWTFTGYGTQTALFTPRLLKLGHEIAIIANWGHEGAPINWEGVQVFGRSFHPWAMDVIHGHSRSFQADALISLMDTWVFEPQALMGTKWIPWYPVDTEPMPRAIYENLKQAFMIIAMSKYGKEQAEKAGLKSHYVPLGVDTNIYRPIDQMEAREKSNLPKDKFIIGMVAMNKGNPSRKAFFQTIAAFAALRKKHDDVVLYIHTMDGIRNPGDMVNLPEFCNTMGLRFGYTFQNAKDVDVIFANQYRYALGYPDPVMAEIYSSFDVHSLVTMGEGFGLPIIQAQACGCPVIVGDWTSMPELVFAGWKVAKKDAEPFYTNLYAFHYLPRADAIYEQMENAYQMRGNQDYKKRARKGSLAYDADKIIEKYWKPVLADIEEKIKAAPDDNLSEGVKMLRRT